MHPFTKSEIDQIVSFSFEAGEIAAKSFKAKDFTVKVKPDGSKVTSCDVLLSKFFHEKLSKIFDYPIICEEGSLREISGDEFFVIDPIDGTSSFANNSDQFCINIAFVKNKKAVFGLMNAPLFEGGKMVYSDENNQVISISGNSDPKVLNAKNYSSDKLRIVTSGRTKESDIQKYMQKFHASLGDNFTITRVSSAIKFIKVIEGEVDLNLHLRPSMEWDIAPGQAMIEIMGGKLKNLQCENDEFNLALEMEYKKENFKNGPFIAYFNDFSQK